MFLSNQITDYENLQTGIRNAFLATRNGQSALETAVKNILTKKKKKKRKERGFGVVRLCQGVGFNVSLSAANKIVIQRQKVMITTNGFTYINTSLNHKTPAVYYTKWLSDTLAKFRLRVCGLKDYKHWIITKEEGHLTCPVWTSQ